MSSNIRVERRAFVRTALGMLAVAPLAARAFAQGAAPLLIPAIPYKGANAVLFFGLFPVIAFFLLVGGVLGLPHVETRVWGGLLVTLVGLIGFQVARRTIPRMLFAAHPILMALTVTATGNHYFLDSIVGIVVALTALAIVQTRPWTKLRVQRPQQLVVAPCSSR